MLFDPGESEFDINDLNNTCDDEDDPVLKELILIAGNPALLELERRALHGETIKKHPKRFKVCDSCDAVVLNTINTCVVCDNMQFISDPAKVIEMAGILGSRERQCFLDEDYS
jgi:hypothetical protein